MCGIAGFYNSKLNLTEKPNQLCRMLSALRHRGPDEMGYYYDERIGLANARLAIVDLVGGQQPMQDATGRYWIAFNGEIFNFIELKETLKSEGIRFNDNSDTEVLLQSLIHWGVERALERLNGQFAFAFYDKITGQLIFGRDRWGERPLYFYRDGDFLAFSSEIKALAALSEVKISLDPQALSIAARLWTSLPDATVFKNISQLPPSHYAVFEKGNLKIAHYSDKPFHPASLPENEGEAIDAVRAALTQAVKLRLRSDVEVALYLSGGLDSTITSALGQQLTHNSLRSFSVGFEDSAFDETIFQEEAASRLGTRHTSLRISHADIRKYLPDVVTHAETILFRTAPVPLYLLAKKVHEAGIKVVLTGEGADEVFYGYDIFKEAWFIDQFYNFENDDARAAALARLYPYMPHFNQRESKALLPFYRNTANRKGFFSPAHLPRFSNGQLAAGIFVDQSNETDALNAFEASLNQAVAHIHRPLSPVDKTAWAERMTLMHGYLLSSQGDRMSSAHSLEGRYPFLDPSVVALAECLPEAMKLRDGLNEKWILKQAFAALLPERITKRPKQPYRAPGSACLLRGGNDWLDDTIAPDQIVRSSVLDIPAATKLIEHIHQVAPDRISPKMDAAYIVLVTTLLLEQAIQKMHAEPLPDISYMLKIAHCGKSQ